MHLSIFSVIIYTTLYASFDALYNVTKAPLCRSLGFFNIQPSPEVVGQGFHRRLNFHVKYTVPNSSRGQRLKILSSAYSSSHFTKLSLLLEIQLTGQIYVLPSELEALKLAAPSLPINHIPLMELGAVTCVPPTYQLDVEAIAGPPFLYGDLKTFKIYAPLFVRRDHCHVCTTQNITIPIPVHIRYGLPHHSGYVTLPDLGKIIDAKFVTMGSPDQRCHVINGNIVDDSGFRYQFILKDTETDGNLHRIIIPVAIPWHRTFVGLLTALVVWTGFGVILKSLLTKRGFSLV